MYGENRSTSNSHLLLGPRRQESLCAAHFSDFHSLWRMVESEGNNVECYDNAFFPSTFIHIAGCSYYIRAVIHS